MLASASPARLSTLRAVGIEPVVHVSGVDEDAVLAEATRVDGPPSPAQAVLLLASAKAQQVADAVDVGPDSLVLGCDSLLELDGEIFGKPRDAAQATERWERMRGRTGVLHTGHWLVDLRAAAPAPGEPGATDGSATPAAATQVGATSSTVVHFADLSDAEIEAYVATGEPLAVAGAFTVDGLGGAFVTGIEGDYHGVVGVSLPLLRDLLAEVGLTVPDLWAARTP